MKITLPTFAAIIAMASIPQYASALPAKPTPAEMAARDQVAYRITADLTAEIGARQAGTGAEQRARDWAIKRLNAMGFANVREEKFMMPTWVRGKETAAITSPVKMELSVTALGNSGATGIGGINGEIAYFRSFDDLVSADGEAVRGRIVFIDHDMTATQDGSSYGFFGQARFQGPNVAAKKGAIGVIVRSAGTADHDHPHTGNTNFDAGVAAIPAAAISNEDANKFVAEYHKAANNRQKNRKPAPNGEQLLAPIPVAVSLTLTPKNLGSQPSGNVIAEVTGTDPALPAILIACHLDSWDLATGAFDDAAGCGIITAAAGYIQSGQTKPKRTIRILWAGAEEVGIWGGKDYAVKNAALPHALAMESDFGADRVWRADFNLPDSAKSLQDAITRRLALIGIAPGKDKAGGGADIGPIIAVQNLGVIDLQQDGSRYFEIHHNATDTMALIDKNQMRQNVHAWTIVLELLTQYEGDLQVRP